MNDLRSLKQDERLEEMLEVLESMEQELAQKDIILQKKDNEIQILQGQLNESLNLCEKLNSENKAENVQALKNELKQTRELLQSEKEKKKRADSTIEEYQDKLRQAEQEKEYLARCQMGDVEARNALIEHNLRLVAHVAKKYQSPDQETDELISIGIIGLIKAVMTFDPEKNSRLATYAARCIENELLMMLRTRKKRMREVSMYEKIGTDQEGRELRLMDVLESPPLDILEDMEREQNLRHLSDCLERVLSGRELQVICERYGLLGYKERTQREIAKELGISRSYVSRIEKRAVERLREEFQP